MRIRALGIVGLGLIGGSVAKAARARLPGARILAVDCDAVTRKLAMQSGMADMASAGAEALAAADLVIIATPIGTLEECARAIAPVLKSGAVVSDVASVKQAAMAAMAAHLPSGAVFVPGHPVAGSERSGFEAAAADLFLNKKVILTPEDPQIPPVAAVAEFWKALGAEVLYMPAALHDRIYAAVSHLPQYLSFSFNRLNWISQEKNEEILRRFLRLKNSPFALWRDIFAANRMFLLQCVEEYRRVLTQIIGELSEAAPGEKADANEARNVLFPYVAASCLAAVAAGEEDALGFSLKPFAGSGFKDFTAPLSAPAEEMLARISANAAALLPLLKDFAAKLTEPQ